jgi:hypothetical protein
MDVANQFPEIGIFFTDDRFISVLPPARRAYASERKR